MSIDAGNLANMLELMRKGFIAQQRALENMKPFVNLVGVITKKCLEHGIIEPSDIGLSIPVEPPVTEPNLTELVDDKGFENVNATPIESPTAQPSSDPKVSNGVQV